VVVVVSSTAVQHSKYSSGESSPVQGSIFQGCALGSSASISCAGGGGGGRCIVESLASGKRHPWCGSMYPAHLYVLLVVPCHTAVHLAKVEREPPEATCTDTHEVVNTLCLHS
jgi:hypothetical protein